MKKEILDVLLIGVGGYGTTYVRALLNNAEALGARIKGCVDPYAANSALYADIVAANIPIYNDAAEFFAVDHADVACIATPINFHLPQTICCLEHGCDVLCEKPVCATIDDVQTMIDARDRTGKAISIGYQWSHSKAILDMKQDILAGIYGKPVQFKALVLWPRDLAYYSRGIGWAGKRKNKNGMWLLDSVASNATAHYLHNMFFVTGDTMDRSAQLAQVEAEVYRANAIDMFDTCAIRCTTTQGAKMLFFASHALAPEEKSSPLFRYEFENGVIEASYSDVSGNGAQLIGRTKDGTMRNYGDPFANQDAKIGRILQIARGEAQVVCGPEAAATHTRCINAVAELFPETPVFPEAVVRRNDERVWCDSLGAILTQCYEQGKLPYEAGVSWAVEPRSMDLTDYNHFGLK